MGAVATCGNDAASCQTSIHSKQTLINYTSHGPLFQAQRSRSTRVRIGRRFGGKRQQPGHAAFLGVLDVVLSSCRLACSSRIESIKSQIHGRPIDEYGVALEFVTFLAESKSLESQIEPTLSNQLSMNLDLLNEITSQTKYVLTMQELDEIDLFLVDTLIHRIIMTV